MAAPDLGAPISAASWLSLRKPPAHEGQTMMFVTPSHVEAASTLAVVASSNEPLLFLAADLKVIAASASFCRAFQIDPASVPGRQLADLGAGEWASPQVGSLLKATAAGTAQIEAYQIDLVRKDHAPRCLLLNARKLEDGDEDRVRLLLAVTDVTVARAEARQKDDLLREKAVLLQEVQHRVANSLQIIASVLMQSARKVQSEETRTHLFDAHQRVMSVAALQQHLAASTIGEVTLRPYLAALCESISASMIRDHSKVSLDVAVDESITGADVSVSLGLIVTELVINALKHAFPNDSSGKIKVDYSSRGPNWTLSVGDTGVGIAKDGANAKPGLGTNIVQALASQLQATIKVSEAHPGTVVSVAHSQVAAVHSAASATLSENAV